MVVTNTSNRTDQPIGPHAKARIGLREELAGFDARIRLIDARCQQAQARTCLSVMLRYPGAFVKNLFARPRLIRQRQIMVKEHSRVETLLLRLYRQETLSNGAQYGAEFSCQPLHSDRLWPE